MSEDRPLRCPSCGTQNRADARWCSNCAQPLSSQTPSTPAPSTPAPSAPTQAPSAPAGASGAAAGSGSSGGHFFFTFGILFLAAGLLLPGLLRRQREHTLGRPAPFLALSVSPD